jgi:enolase
MVMAPPKRLPKRWKSRRKSTSPLASDGRARHSGGVADEAAGGRPSPPREALEALVRSIERAGFTPGNEAAISLDIAASEFGRDGAISLAWKAGNSTATAWPRCCSAGASAFRSSRWRIRSPEDDPAGLRRFTAAIGHKVQVIGR